jgi:hypothetical protein
MNLKIVWVVVAGGCLVGFGSGLLVGRHYPAHSYQKYGETRFMLDTATGKLCDPFKDPNANPIDAQSTKPDPFAAYGGHAIDSKPSTDLSEIWKATYPPACGK